MSCQLEEVKNMVLFPRLLREHDFELAKNSGHKGTAKCHLHGNDRTASLHWHEQRGYYCFGCGVGGDKISFLQWVNGCDFKEAKKHLYQLAGVPLPIYKNPLDTKVRGGLSSVHGRDTDCKIAERHLYDVMRLSAATDDLLFAVKTERLTGELEYLERKRRKGLIALEDYYMQQQLVEMKLNDLDEQRISHNYRAKRGLRNYYAQYIR